MSATLTLIQLNIEGSRHLEAILPFLKEQKPDVICMQELREKNISLFTQELGMSCFFVPMSLEKGVPTGLGIFSRLPTVAPHSLHYGGNSSEQLFEYVHGDRAAGYASSKFVLAIVDVEKEGELFRIATTHFPVTDRGDATEYQRGSMKKMLEHLSHEGEFVLTGDFNAPRGGEMFSLLAQKYKDNIPQEITTSIDGSLHRAGQLPHMVDGIFSTPGYEVTNVVGHTGISDHWGFTASVKKN